MAPGRVVTREVMVGRVTHPMTVAGRPIPDPVARLRQYGRDHAGTVRKFDAIGGSQDPYVISAEDVHRTRKVNSRISNAERDWFVQTAKDAPWVGLAPNSCLIDADPATELGRSVYEAADQLYRHFQDQRLAGVSTGKISKVLHVKRPDFFPILDARLTRLYKDPAKRQAAKNRDLDRGRGRLYWLAVREDLAESANQEGLARCRQELADDPDPVLALVAAMSNVRLLDILAWDEKVPT